jgi:hypothetical protein
LVVKILLIALAHIDILLMLLSDDHIK